MDLRRTVLLALLAGCTAGAATALADDSPLALWTQNPNGIFGNGNSGSDLGSFGAGTGPADLRDLAKTHDISGIHDSGASGAPADIANSVAEIQKLWPRDMETYCVNYDALMTAILQRQFPPLDLETVEAAVKPVLTTRDRGLSIYSTLFTWEQGLALRVLLQKAWLGGVSATDTLRITKRCIEFMEVWKTGFVPGYDRLRYGGFTLDMYDDIERPKEERLSFHNQEIGKRQAIEKEEIDFDNSLLLVLLKKAEQCRPELTAEIDGLSAKSRSLRNGLWADPKSR